MNDWSQAENILQAATSINDAIARSDLADLSALPLDPATAQPQINKDVAFLDNYFGTPGLYAGLAEPPGQD